MIAGYVVYWLRDVLTPILLAFIIAYVLDPVVDRLEAWHVPRPAGIAIVLGGTLGALILFLALVAPGIAADSSGRSGPGSGPGSNSEGSPCRTPRRSGVRA